ncbi:hypothetical protein BABINDRAFT_23201, partial [Babjeviella inositovora NRRL Y-12698]
MRESNYKSIVGNRAAVCITTSLYDRRALDCTSDRPLVNSLNHLTFLASSSAKVRETLANDGGLERLIDILHECRGQSTCQNPQPAQGSLLVAWKWTLAFQCLVLVGTRGTERIRKRVVEAGMIPIIATVLDNYLLQHAPPAIHTPGERVLVAPRDLTSAPATATVSMNLTNLNISNPVPEPADFLPDRLVNTRGRPDQPVQQQLHPQSVRASNSADEIETILLMMNDDSPRDHSQRIAALIEDEINQGRTDFSQMQLPRVFENGVLIPRDDDVVWSLQLLAFISKYAYLKQDLQETYIKRGMSLRDGPTHTSVCVPGLENDDMENDSDSVMDDLTQSQTQMTGHLQSQLIESSDCSSKLEKAVCFRKIRSTVTKKMQFEQMLTRFSCVQKGLCDKRKLSAKWDYDTYDLVSDEDMDHSLDALEKVNIFQLVEKYSVKLVNTQDMCYWSGVVMRNSCRKDDARGGVRQCAYFDCGKWEEFPRQFAKCRRCKRTKYCSKDCQLKAWNYHRHWCVQSHQSSGTQSL